MMHPVRRLSAALVSVSVIVAAGACSLFDESRCTSIGCEDMLTLGLAGVGDSDLPAGDYALKVTDLAKAKTIDCTVTVLDDGAVTTAKGQVCASDGEGGVTFPSFAPERLHVVAHKGDALAVDVEAPMTYTQRQPNGPNCSPTCSIGTFTVALDVGSNPAD